MLEEVQNLMNSFLVSLGEKDIVDFYDKVPKGKMLRAKLILEIAGHSEEALELAAIVEMIHSASLLHDDVIDSAVMRRGAKSFNAEFGDKNAIMMGDVLYSCAFSKLTKFPYAISSCLANAVSLLSVGEIMDIELSKSFNTDKEKYFKMIYHKTASLIEASAKCAATLTKFSEKDFVLYGKNLGLAFQIIDDVLDIVSSPSVLGKPVMSDFRDGKVTLPYIYVHKKLLEREKCNLERLYKKSLNSYEISWIKEKMVEHKVIEKCIKEAKILGDYALKTITKYNMKGLEETIRHMVERNF